MSPAVPGKSSAVSDQCHCLKSAEVRCGTPPTPEQLLWRLPPPPPPLGDGLPPSWQYNDLGAVLPAKMGLGRTRGGRVSRRGRQLAFFCVALVEAGLALGPARPLQRPDLRRRGAGCLGGSGAQQNDPPRAGGEAGLQPQDVRRRAAPERAWRRRAGVVRGPTGAQPRGRGWGPCGSLRAGPGTWRRGPGGRSGIGPAGGGGGPLRRRRGRSRSAMEQEAPPPAPPGAVAGGRARRRRERNAEPPRVS